MMVGMLILYASLYGRHNLLNTFLSDSKYNLGAELVNTPNKMGYVPLVMSLQSRDGRAQFSYCYPMAQTQELFAGTKNTLMNTQKPRVILK